MLNSKLHKIIAEQLRISADKVKLDSFFTNDLGADSIEIIELVMAVEKSFDIEIPDEDAEKLKTVSSLQAYLLQHGKI